MRVPTRLAAEMSRASALGQAAWEQARAAADYGRFRDAMARHLELRHEYVGCFTGHEHPYDVLLDDFEPAMTAAKLRPLFAELRDALVPLVAATAGPLVLPFGGDVDVESQRRACMVVLEGIGFDPDGWRLDVAPHPFAQALGSGDVRVTTRYDLHDFAGAYFGALHEFGHGLYEAQIPERLARSPLGSPVSLGVHESQSRLWENLVGRSLAFCTWIAPHLAGILPGYDDVRPEELYRRVNTVHRNLIRVEADETTYNLHIVLRFELELALIEGTLGVDDLPHAWNEGMHRLLGLDVPDDAQGVLQDVHWGAGMIGYFPTYTLGQPDGGAALGGARGGPAGHRRGDRAGRLRAAARLAGGARPCAGPAAAAARAPAPGHGPGARRRAVPPLLAGKARRSRRPAVVIANTCSTIPSGGYVHWIGCPDRIRSSSPARASTTSRTSRSPCRAMPSWSSPGCPGRASRRSRSTRSTRRGSGVMSSR